MIRTSDQAIPNQQILQGLGLFLLLATMALISGCAGTARGVDKSVYSSVKATKVSSQKTPRAAALVIIRYPAMIHANAENLYVSSFAINAIGGEVPYDVQVKPQTARIAQSVIEKSSYYAMSLYHELTKILPAGSVLLSPHIIVWDKKNNLHSRPILATEQIPAVLTIDFNIYSFPDVNKLMDAPPVTFGDLVTPLIVVKASRLIRPTLDGLLISSPPLVSAAWQQTRAEVEEQLQSRIDDKVHPLSPSLDFIEYLRERSGINVTLPLMTGEGGNQSRQAVEQYALEKIQMNGEVIANLPKDSSIDPFATGFVKGASSRIVKLLNSIDYQRATFFARQVALKRFDPELAKIFFLQSDDESVRARLQLADALIGAEREFLSAQSESIYNGTYLGNYGAKMRTILAAEHRMLEERRKLAHSQNMTTAVAVIALAGAVYGAAVATSAAGSAAIAASSAGALAGSTWALHSSLKTKTESQEVSKYFLARMAPAFDRQMSVQMEWLESKEVITAKGFAEFRNKTLSLYQSRVRSMAVNVTQDCHFKRPGFSGEDRWFGRCRDGLATGRGYGLILDGNGDSLEYIGYTEQGFASGSGAMIIRTRRLAGTVYYEGTFKNGLPDGVVKVEKPGETIKVRQYRQGIDIGKGEPGKLKRLNFATMPEQATMYQP